MSYRGTVSGGMVILDNPGVLPEGAAVKVALVRNSASRRRKPQPLTLSQKLLRLAGTAQGLPSDMALNHDHYLHGLPKK